VHARLGTVAVGTVNAKDVSEGPSELRTHGAVENKVGRAVNEDQNIPDVAERHVHVLEDSLIDGAGEGEDALRQFGENERQDDDDQHERRATVADVAVRRRGRLATSSDETETRPTTLGATSHGADQQRAEHGQQRARRHFKHDAVQPENEHLQTG